MESPSLQMIAGGMHGEVATQVLTSVPLAYMCGAAYYSLFKLGMFSFYQIIPGATQVITPFFSILKLLMLDANSGAC